MSVICKCTLKLLYNNTRIHHRKVSYYHIPTPKTYVALFIT
jgi:hypothetical protein